MRAFEHVGQEQEKDVLQVCEACRNDDMYILSGGTHLTLEQAGIMAMSDDDLKEVGLFMLRELIAREMVAVVNKVPGGHSIDNIVSANLNGECIDLWPAKND